MVSVIYYAQNYVAGPYKRESTPAHKWHTVYPIQQ